MSEHIQRKYAKQAVLALVDKLTEYGVVNIEAENCPPAGIDIKVEAPYFYVWSATMCHELSVHYYTDRPAAWLAIYEDMQEGVEPCPAWLERDCEWCEDSAAEAGRGDLQDEVNE